MTTHVCIVCIGERRYVYKPPCLLPAQVEQALASVFTIYLLFVLNINVLSLTLYVTQGLDSGNTDQYSVPTVLITIYFHSSARTTEQKLKEEDTQNVVALFSTFFHVIINKLI